MDIVLFEIGGASITLIDFISSLLGLTCVFLAGRGSKYNFWVGYLYTVALFLLFWHKNLLASLMLQPVSLCINIIGHYRWTHPKPKEASKDGQLKVTNLTWMQRAFAVASVLLLSFAWGALLDRLFPADPHPYLDSCVTVLILVAQFLSAQKKWDCWIAWLLVNITQFTLHISVGNIAMSFVSALYLLNGVASLFHWKKMK
ncbi:MAG: nicotinamide mononucleotide transporter [Bacteroidales bacterium]|jgi:nicotinamide mononucleotide transporter|nr:nicotinamide mononucleotide transporter [Bacteroidales bacterium]MBQ2452312.1 nicotinamide mononucleotide transporter [Bacteroidales bacterium]